VFAQYGPVFLASFLASTVEFVEAFTIVLVIGVTINWRSSLTGAALAVVALAAIVGILGVALVRFVPLDVLRLVIGLLLVLFGLKWLKKALMRYAGLKALHDEEAIYEEQLAEVKARGGARPDRLDPFGVVTSFKSVLLEGLEVAFIVITFGIQSGTRGANGIPASAAGAALAFVVVVVLGSLVRAPLQKVPENTLKFVVGVMLISFGSFWGGEGLGIEWWSGDIFLVILVVFYLCLSGALFLWLRSRVRRLGQPRAAESDA
jgi:Ca2+/H+ antiporter, TMEM165/GDT1 family